MIKSILVCTDGSPYGAGAVQYGLHLARDLKARLSVLHVLDSRMLEGPLMADISGWVGAQPFSDQLTSFQELLKEKGDSILSAVGEECAKAGIEVNATLKMGHPARIILAEESRTELVVMGLRGEHAEWSGDMTGSIVERVVRRSVKPCLLTPETFQPIRKILAAYDGSGHASRALHEAIELAGALSAPLVILAVCENDDIAKTRAIAEDAMRLVRAHEGVAANLVVRGDPTELILRKAEELACNLVVVGAYGHGRIREMFLGSVTAGLIAKAQVPLLLAR
jgi:nucleotide-binding universal stress UspA family protein